MGGLIYDSKLHFTADLYFFIINIKWMLRFAFKRKWNRIYRIDLKWENLSKVQQCLKTKGTRVGGVTLKMYSDTVSNYLIKKK